LDVYLLTAVLQYFRGLFGDFSIFPGSNQGKLLQIFGKIYRKDVFLSKIHPYLSAKTAMSDNFAFDNGGYRSLW